MTNTGIGLRCKLLQTSSHESPDVMGMRGPVTGA